MSHSLSSSLLGSDYNKKHKLVTRSSSSSNNNNNNNNNNNTFAITITSRPQFRSIIYLPTDILLIIMGYYSFKAFQDLIRFGAISQQFKDLADNSLLWTSMHLSFKPRLADNITIRIQSSALSSAKQILGIQSLCPSVEYLVCTGVVIDNTEGLHLVSAAELRRWFVPIFVKFNQLWHWHAKWDKVFINHYDSLRSVFDMCILTPCVLGACVCLAVASVLLQGLCTRGTASTFSSSSNAGFVFVYLFVCLYLCPMLLAVYEDVISSEIIHSEYLEYKLFTLKTLDLPNAYFSLLMLGTIGYIMLVHIKLSYDVVGMTWTQCTIPMWCMVVSVHLALSWMMYFSGSSSKKDIEGLLVKTVVSLVVCLPLTLISHAYDEHSRGDSVVLGYSMLSLCPMVFGVMCITLYKICKLSHVLLLRFNLTKDRYLFGRDSGGDLHIITILFNIVGTATCVAAVMSILFLFLRGFQYPDMPLGLSPYTLICLFLNCFHISIVISGVDYYFSPYLRY